MGYQPWYQGDTFPSLQIPLSVEGVADDITSVLIAQFSVIFKPTFGTPVTGTGTVTLKTAIPAVIYYKLSPADVAASFTGALVVKANFPPSNTTADEVVYDPIPFNIT